MEVPTGEDLVFEEQLRALYSGAAETLRAARCAPLARTPAAPNT